MWKSWWILVNLIQILECIRAVSPNLFPRNGGGISLESLNFLLEYWSQHWSVVLLKYFPAEELTLLVDVHLLGATADRCSVFPLLVQMPQECCVRGKRKKVIQTFYFWSLDALSITYVEETQQVQWYT